MLALWEAEPRSVKDLSHTVQAEPRRCPRCSSASKRFGYLTRSRNAGDERSVTVGLTPAGRELRAEAEKIPQQIVDRLGLPLSTLESLNTALREVMAAAQHAKRRPPRGEHRLLRAPERRPGRRRLASLAR
ncbi:hypothetical protein GCM10020366_07740 [Saccharopolyspora gregorii]|uniref:MarR family transcriptional regulator n=1 Tax=Saccharopolyspora gregorii TaxID=33914 RepID=A0ABP6RHT7_9PSEU